MDYVKSLIAGFAGAAALNILHETLRRLDPEAPRIDILGEEAVSKSTKAMDISSPKGENLENVTMAGDLLGNATYFAAIGMGNKKFMLLRALGAGFSAGMAAIKLPEPMGLDEKPVAGSDKRKVMTVAYYVFGALVTAGVLSLMADKRPFP